MNGTDWNIEGLYTSIGARMVGKDNKPLALEGIGNLVFSWYRIVRDDYGSLKIIVFENFGDSERGFVMRLYRESYTEDLILRQKATVGYKFEDIVFSVMDGDGISYVTSSKDFSGATLHNDVATDCYVTYYPYLNAKVSTVFESDDMRAFAWNVNGDGSLKKQIAVKVPTDILNGNVILGNAEREYSDKRLMTESDLVNVSDSFTVKARTKGTLTGGNCLPKTLC